MVAESEKRKRPFYADYAWAFDLIIDRPIRKECGAIVGWLVERGALPGARLLDAGCGTGRYSVELARRGYSVHGIDASAELIDVANESTREGCRSLSFAVGDILERPAGRYDAILCRGVLNDLIEDVDRALVLEWFSEALQPGGVLILDVREWESSAERKAREPVFRKSVETERGRLTFSSTTELDREKRLLLLRERHTLVTDGNERASDYHFVMRCWTHAELESGLERAGFGNAVFYGAYDPSVPDGATDRIVAVAKAAA
jgi:SAM-dependent methyltransferase